jgi:glycolate oxidase FAD binding subunit
MAAFDRLAALLASELGAECVTRLPGTTNRQPSASYRAELICTPPTAEQVSTVLRLCAQEKCAVSARGGDTGACVGNAARQPHVAIDLTRLNRIVEHDHANLTVTAECGATLALLQETLSRQRQFLPFDVPAPAKATLGGTIALNLNGLRRGFYGGVRDLVIGMKAALITGEQIKAGGKVVKNVAGYDMCKLFIGSLGTLGVITEATVRVAPLPEKSASVVVTGDFGGVNKFLSAFSQRQLFPAAVTLTNNGSAENWQIAFWCEGVEENLARHVRELQDLARPMDLPARILHDGAHRAFWAALCEAPLEPGRCIYRLTVPQTTIGPCIDAVVKLGEPHPRIIADALVGTIWLSWPGATEFAGRLPQLGSLSAAHRGHAVLFAASGAMKENIDVWGPAPASHRLMRNLKQQFDPLGLLNPGRFISGL